MKTIKILMNLSFKKFAMFGLVGSMSFVMTACNNGSSNKSNVPGVIPASGVPNNPRINNVNNGNGQIQTATGTLSQDPALTNLLLKKESEEAERVKSIREAQERNEAEARKSKIALEKLKQENLLLMQQMNRNAGNPCVTVDPCGNRRVVNPPTVIANPCPPTTDPCAGQGGNRNGNNNSNNGRTPPTVIANPCPPTTDPCAGQGGSNSGHTVVILPPQTGNGNGNSNGSPCTAVVTDPCTGERVTVPVVDEEGSRGGQQQVVVQPGNPCHTVNPCGTTTIQVVVTTDAEANRRTVELNERTIKNFEELEKAKRRLDEQQAEIDRLQKELIRIEANKTTTVVCCERGHERNQETVTTRTETVTTRTETVTRGEEEVVEVERDGVIVRIAKGIGDAITGIGRLLFGSSEKRRVPAPVEERSIVTVTEAKESCDEAKVQLETMKVAVTEAETKLTTAIKERDEARAELVEVKQNSVPKEQVQVVVAKLNETEAELAKKNAEVEELNRRLAAAQSEIDKLKAAGASKVAKQPAKPVEKNGPNKPVAQTPAKPVAPVKPVAKAPVKPAAKPATPKAGQNCVTKEVQVCTPDNGNVANNPVVADAKAAGKTSEEKIEQASNNAKVAQLLLGKLSVSEDTTSEIKAESTFKATGRTCAIVLDNRTTTLSAMKLAFLQFAYKTESGEAKAESVVSNLISTAELSNPNEANLKKVFAEDAGKKTVNGQNVYVVAQCSSNAQSVANNPKVTKSVIIQCREVAFKNLDGLQSEKPEEIYAAAMNVINAQARILSVSSTTIEMNFNQDKLVDAKVRNDLRDHSKGDAFKLSLVQSNEMRCQ